MAVKTFNKAVLTPGKLVVYEPDSVDVSVEVPAADVTFSPSFIDDGEYRSAISIEGVIEYLSATQFPHARAAERYGERVRLAGSNTGIEFYCFSTPD